MRAVQGHRFFANSMCNSTIDCVTILWAKALSCNTTQAPAGFLCFFGNLGIMDIFVVHMWWVVIKPRLRLCGTRYTIPWFPHLPLSSKFEISDWKLSSLLDATAKTRLPDTTTTTLEKNTSNVSRQRQRFRINASTSKQFGIMKPTG